MLYSLPYFTRPYKEQDDRMSIREREINGRTYTLYRRNHGLAHSLRQGFLTRDIITLLTHSNSPLGEWLRAQDSTFPIKAAILASFQRSGRESEVSSSADPERYLRYEEQDAANFIEGLAGRQWFHCYHERIAWSRCLLWSSSKSLDVFENNLSKVIHSAHLLDLRRIMSFDKGRIKLHVCSLLGIELGSPIVDALWEQSGKYLAACGDTDMEGRDQLEDKFFLLHDQPDIMWKTLRQYMLSPCSTHQ